MGFAGVCGAQKTKYKLDQYVLSPQLICSLSARTVLFNLCVLGGLEDETQSSTGIYTVRSHAVEGHTTIELADVHLQILGLI